MYVLHEKTPSKCLIIGWFSKRHILNELQQLSYSKELLSQKEAKEISMRAPEPEALLASPKGVTEPSLHER